MELFGQVSLERGLIPVARAEHHPAKAGEEPGVCGLCGSMVWISIRKLMFSGMNPGLPVLCCICSQLSMKQLMQVFPGLRFEPRDVPDMARQGVFN
jgi:hypothetical protein